VAAIGTLPIGCDGAVFGTSGARSFVGGDKDGYRLQSIALAERAAVRRPRLSRQLLR